MTASKQAVHTIFWQGSKAVFSVLFVWLYGRLTGVEVRGYISLLLLNVQIAMMLVEMIAGSAIPNMIIQFGFKQVVKAILPIILGLIPFWIIAVIFLGSMGWIELINSPYMWISYLVFAPLMILFLALLNLQYGYYQTKGWIERRNRIQTLIEFLKIGLLICALSRISGDSYKNRSILDVFIESGDNPHTSNLDMMVVLGVLCVSTFVGWLISVVFSFKSMQLDWRNSIANSIAMGRHGFSESVKAQTGHLLYFLITRLPVWMIVWQYRNHGWVGVLANVFLMMDTLMIFANSHGVVLHAKALNEDLENHETSHFVSRSVLLVGVVGGIVCLIPSSFFEWVFGSGFGEMHNFFLAIFPALGLAAFSSPVAHKLHAESKFNLLIRIYFEALLVLIVGWIIMEWVMGVNNLNFGHAFLCGNTEEGNVDPFPWGLLAMNLSFGWLAYRIWSWGGWQWHFLDDFKSIVNRIANIFATK